MAISVEILGISFQMIYTFSNRFVVQVSKEYVCRVVGAFPEWVANIKAVHFSNKSVEDGNFKCSLAGGWFTAGSQ